MSSAGGDPWAGFAGAQSLPAPAPSDPWAQFQAAPAVPQPPAPAASRPSALVDMARSIPGGLAKGIAGVVGLPGDIANLAAQGAQYAVQNLGLPNPTIPGTKNVPFPDSAEANAAMSAPTGGYYQPQTVPGQYAQTVAEFAPSAIAPGTMAQKIARVLVQGGASETAGQAAKGTAVEPYARALGAVLGNAAAGAGFGMASSAMNPAPSLDDLATAKSAAYKAADQAGVVISPDSFQKFASDTAANITSQNVVQADIHPNTMAALNILQDEASAGVPISLSRVDAIRQAVNGAAENASGINGNNSDLRLVGKVKGALDKYVNQLDPSDTLSGDPQTAVPILQNARDIAQREFKGQQIQKLIDLAGNSASTNYSASGYEQALRAQFKNYNAQLIKNPNLAATYSDPERAAIQSVAEGGPIGNSLRYLGKFSAHGPMSTVLGMGLGSAVGSHVGAGAEGGMAGAVAVPAIGEAARAGASAITNNNAKLAAALMRRGAPLVAPPNSTAAKLGSLLLSQVGH